jgi:hypothetical protein
MKPSPRLPNHVSTGAKYQQKDRKLKNHCSFILNCYKFLIPILMEIITTYFLPNFLWIFYPIAYILENIFSTQQVTDSLDSWSIFLLEIQLNAQGSQEIKNFLPKPKVNNIPFDQHTVRWIDYIYHSFQFSIHINVTFSRVPFSPVTSSLLVSGIIFFILRITGFLDFVHHLIF